MNIMENDVNEKKGNTDTKKEGKAGAKLLFGVVALAFLIFAVCVIKFFCDGCKIRDSVLNLINNSRHLTLDNIMVIKDLQTYYKDASNFQIVTLLYVLISAVIMGVLGLYTKEQKDRVDIINKNVEERIKKIDSGQEKLQTLMDENQDGFDRLFFFQQLGIALTHASQINVLCQSEGNPSDITMYITRLRDCLRALEKSCHGDWVKNLSEDNKEIILKQIGSVVDMLDFAYNEKYVGYTEVTHCEFMEYCESLLNRLK